MDAMYGFGNLLNRLFGGEDAVDTGVDALKELLDERQRTLDLHAEYKEPTADLRGEPTAVFPYVVFEGGDLYRTGVKEFPIPDGGIEEGSELAAFLKEHTDTVDLDALDQINGVETEAMLADNGTIEVA